MGTEVQKLIEFKNKLDFCAIPHKNYEFIQIAIKSGIYIEKNQIKNVATQTYGSLVYKYTGLIKIISTTKKLSKSNRKDISDYMKRIIDCLQEVISELDK